jgi:hypothetical protein
MEALIFSRIDFAMAVPSIFWAVMTGRLSEKELKDFEETEGTVCAPVESALRRSQENLERWRGARKEAVCSKLRDLAAEFPRNKEVLDLIPQISIVRRGNAEC